MSLVEAIPNVSEGRTADVLTRLAGAVSRVGGVALLDRTADPSHHRAVLTLAGTVDAMEEAALELARVVVATVDVTRHTGVHPRVGALDVIPFVPLGPTPMSTCVALAHRVGTRLARELALPVYFYEQATRGPVRRGLEDIRRGGIEGLRARMREPGWEPDCGPAHLHPSAGASCVGARGPLVAWNLHLDCDDLTIAQDIARRIRASAGGLPHVKALGLRLAHLQRVQVSMNLTDYRITPMALVYASVERYARAHGVAIAQSEVIGLVPRQALEAASAAIPALGTAHAHQVLEDRLVEHGLPPHSP